MISMRRLVAGLLAALQLSAPAWAETNVNFNFEPNAQGWTTQTTGTVEQPWTYSNTSPDKGWQAFRGVDDPQSGSYLVSPLLVLDPPSSENQKYVAVRVKHFFNFGPSVPEENPWSLGQVQYSYAGGAWQGIPTADFDGTTAEHYAPNYPNPPGPLPSPFISQTNIPAPGTPVQAWSGETNGFYDRTHRDSYFQLDYGSTFTDPYPFAEGQSIQFRFLAGTLDSLTPPPGSPQLIWEITAVEVIHAGVVPEPGAIVLAVAGLGSAVAFLRRGGRSTRRTRESTAGS